MGLAELQSENLRDSPYASLAREIVMEYWQQQYVGLGSQPQAQATRHLNPMLLNCGCLLCQGLHRFFVQTPNQPQAVFGNVMSDCAGLMHFSAVVKKCAGFCDYSIRHDGLYCKWWLTKRGFLPREEQSRRIQSARAVLGKANQLHLSLVLGEERYERLMGMSAPSLIPLEEEGLPYETLSQRNCLSHGLP